MHEEHLLSAAAQRRKRLAVVLLATGLYMLAEIAGGLLTNSLALLADAVHMLTDLLALAMALVAIGIAQRPPTPHRTYGYHRFEILAALANAMLLLVLSGFLVYEASRRFHEVPEVRSLPMLLVASGGILVNLFAVWLLRESAEESVNVRGAFLHALSDLLGSLGAVIAAGIMLATNWYYADPIATVLTTLLIVRQTWELLHETIGVLLEGTPAQVDLPELRAALEAVPAVESVHDLHVWSITSGYLALTAHARLTGRADRMLTLMALQRVAQEQFSIDHCTIQLEEPGFTEAATHA